MALLVVSLAILGGCGADGGCREVCEKDDECVGGVDVESCTAICEDLTEGDEAYADAIAERASCIDGLSCQDIFTECRPSGE